MVNFFSVYMVSDSKISLLIGKNKKKGDYFVSLQAI